MNDDVYYDIISFGVLCAWPQTFCSLCSKLIFQQFPIRLIFVDDSILFEIQKKYSSVVTLQ